MVTACKNYVTEDGMTKIWDQPRQSLIKKLSDCTTLYKNYQEAFQKAKQTMEGNPNEKPFEFSEMYIFGKFEAFCKRLSKVRNLLTRFGKLFNGLLGSKRKCGI